MFEIHIPVQPGLAQNPWPPLVKVRLDPHLLPQQHLIFCGGT